MKKLISTILTVVVLFNFILITPVQTSVMAAEKSEAEETIDLVDKPETMEDIAEGNENATSSSNLVSKILSTVATILVSILNVIPLCAQVIMSVVSEEGFSIEKAVFNKIDFFNTNYFETSTSNVNNSLKESVSKFYYINRLIACTLEAVVLIYIGIRMALSVTVSDKVKYKHMLIGWFESMLILFSLQYVMIVIFSLSDIFENIITEIYNKFIVSGEEGLESLVITTVLNPISNATGWTCVLYTVFYWYIVFLQIKFFYSYLNRLLTIGFLIIISPFITVIYSIDKAGDGKAQSFKIWFKEFAINVFIQPIYALIYTIFMLVAGEILKYSLFLAMIFLLMFTKVEKIIYKLFNLKANSLKAVQDEHKKNK